MADRKLQYASPASVTFALETTPLASSPTLVAGYETSPVDNTSNLYLDYIARGKIRTGTSPTANTTIEIWLIPLIGASTYPDVFDGTASDETVTSRNTLLSIGKLCHQITVDSTSNADYPFEFALSNVPGIGSAIPPKFCFFVTQNTTAALNSGAGVHTMEIIGIYELIA